jgi:hypothetical protein
VEEVAEATTVEMIDHRTVRHERQENEDELPPEAGAGCTMDMHQRDTPGDEKADKPYQRADGNC